MAAGLVREFSSDQGTRWSVGGPWADPQTACRPARFPIRANSGIAVS